MRGVRGVNGVDSRQCIGELLRQAPARLGELGIADHPAADRLAVDPIHEVGVRPFANQALRQPMHRGGFHSGGQRRLDNLKFLPPIEARRKRAPGIAAQHRPALPSPLFSAEREIYPIVILARASRKRLELADRNGALRLVSGGVFDFATERGQPFGRALVVHGLPDTTRIAGLRFQIRRVAPPTGSRARPLLNDARSEESGGIEP